MNPPTPTPATRTPPIPKRERSSPDGRAPREALSLRFVHVAKALVQVARAEGLVAPVFRSPPRLVGVSRSIRHQRDGVVTVSVALRNRPWGAVLADMVEGVVATNRLQGVAADRCRTQLWACLDEAGERAA